MSKGQVKFKRGQLKHLLKKIDKLKKVSEQEVSNELGRISSESVRTIKKTVKTKDAILKNSARAERNKEDKVRIYMGALYAAFVEFGTGQYVSLDDMRELGIPDSYAMQFKGEKDGYMKPQPYFFGNIRKEFARGITRMNKTLKRLTR